MVENTLFRHFFGEKRLPILSRGADKELVDEWRNCAHEQGAILVVDKPLTWTSFDVVAKMRGIVKFKRIGHAGTLDPLASGVLVVCFGKATKEVETIQSYYKDYTVTIKLGATTRSDDGETEEENHTDTTHVTKTAIEYVLPQFIGTVLQTPPAFSAVWVDGKRAYQEARKGKAIVLEPRPIRIDSIEIIEWANPYLTLTIRCGKGTYIRSIARDIGVALQVGGYVSELRRTAVGEFVAEEAHAITELTGMFSHLRKANQNENV